MLPTDISSPSATGNFLWSPNDVLHEFPTSHANWTSVTALGYAALYQWNYLGISQPGRPVESKIEGFAYSEPFTLHSQLTEDGVRAQLEKGHAEEYDRWKLGVGIGVGLGVPILLVACVMLGYRQGRSGAWDWRNHVPKA